MVEMNLFFNVIGYVLDVVGMYGILGDVDLVIKDLDLKD